ncbi:anion transporter [Maritimibacter sp. 55A14]|uniref:SLC13 family permease n=1 Tax=Maritimibacter sp. 55A14 TaxID=2174844 RepID=UPI000D6061BC|nr:DASS family sodium-coupled anion symporter [Maritimibacter sp. 55A14]PWE32187.1 anion transporter [Maritimibacter sp. 55A14]
MPPSENGRRDHGGLSRAGLLAGPVCAGLMLLAGPPGALDLAAWRMAALTAWMVIWWLTEAVPLPATALLPLVLLPLLGIRGAAATAESYASPLLFLFLGGFMLAAAVQRVGLHRRIALRIVGVVGTSPARIVLGFMLATAFLSMWISNTATAIMMYAVALSVIGFVGRRTPDPRARRNFGVALMLGVAYSASIGGVGTLIGTPPNAMLASFLQAGHGIEIGFARWMLIGLPVVVVMLPAAWLLLTRVAFPLGALHLEDPGAMLAEETRALGPPGAGERLVGAVFLLAAAGWMLRAPIADLTGLPIDDTMIAIAAALLLFALPIPGGEGLRALDWEAARTLPWGILILFGGGLALADGFDASGLAAAIGGAASGLDASPLFLMLAVLATIVFLTEITSNTASTATFLPILAAVAAGLQIDVLALTVPVALGASMAFMMPIATPPNAIVFAYKEMEIRDMVHAGFALNLAAIAIAYAAIGALGGPVLGIAF